jgi:signal peptide peptidase SppA
MTIRAFDVAAGRPWLIQQESLETILQVAERMGDPEAVSMRLGRPLDNTRTVQMRDGVAVIPITGPVFRYANLLTEVSGATATGVIARDFQAAVENPYVRGIVLEINSPGGEATGINELAEAIYQARGTKPIVAYVEGAGASAAYWIASAAGEIVMDPTAIVGSIGVVMSYTDTRERDERSGARRLEIVSSQSPNKRTDPATEAGRAQVQAIVDAMADVFVGAVARNRGVTAETVIADFGSGGVLVGASAVAARMADRLGSLETVIAELAGTASPTTRKTTMGNKSTVTVSNTDDLRLALEAGYTADQIEIEQPAPVSTAVVSIDATAEQIAAAKAEATTAERSRLTALMGMQEEGFEAELQQAVADGTQPGDFALAMLRAQRDRGVSMRGIRSDSPKPAAHGGNTDGTPADSLIATAVALGLAKE